MPGVPYEARKINPPAPAPSPVLTNSNISGSDLLFIFVLAESEVLLFLVS